MKNADAQDGSPPESPRSRRPEHPVIPLIVVGIVTAALLVGVAWNLLGQGVSRNELRRELTPI
jgi:hypothetical protein